MTDKTTANLGALERLSTGVLDAWSGYAVWDNL